MKQIAPEHKLILFIAPVRKGRPQQSVAEGKAFPLIIVLFYLYLEKLAEQQWIAQDAGILLDQKIEEAYSGIETTNKNVEESIDSMLYGAGYLKSGNLYARKVLAHSYLVQDVYKIQAVAGYNWYNTARPELRISSAMFEGLETDGIITLMNTATMELEDWQVKIFGVHDGVREIKGEIEKHIGSKQDYGSEIGRIMFQYDRNEKEKDAGKAEFEAAPWDKQITESPCSWVEVPSLRSVATVAAAVAAVVVSTAISVVSFGSATPVMAALTAAGIGAAITLSAEATFAVADVAGGYKDWDEVGTELAISAATSVISAAGGAAGAAVQGIGGIGGVFLKTGVSVATSATNTVASKAIQYAGDWDGFASSMSSFDTWSGVITSGAGALVTNSLGEMNLGTKVEKLTGKDGKTILNTIQTKVDGFNSSQIGSIQSFNSLVGGLATSALSYGLTGEATFNVLNISNFGAGASCGLLEVSVGNNGVKTRLGTGGTDVSVGTLLSAISGIKNLGMNEKIKKAAQDNNMAQSATALRMLYGFGDDKGLELLDDVLNKKVSLAAGSGPGNAQTVLENGKRTVYLNGYTNDMTREEQLKLGITLGHEAYRDGVKGSIEKQMAETFSAVAGHTAMIKRVQNDSLYSSVMTGIIESDMNLKNDVTRFDYALKNNDWSSFGEYVLGNYDYSADYWKLVKNTDGQYGWQEDGKLDFYLEDGSKIDADYFDGYLNGTVSITGPENVEAKNKLIQNLKDSGYSKKEIKEFLNGTAGFADASVAARNLMSGKLSQSELDAMNKGLYAAQESGLLVKNKIGTLYDTSLPFVLNDGKDVTWITTQYGFDLLNGKIRNHSAVDLVVNDPKDEKYPTGKTKLVVPETSDITLSYGTDIGLKETFSLGNGSEILYGHMDANSIKAYLSQFGTEGVSITSNGKLVNVPGGMLTGYIGNTGSKTTGPHLHLGYKKISI